MNKLVRNEFEWIKDLPDSVLMHILSFLDGKGLLMKYSLVSKTWKRLIDSQTLWRTKCVIHMKMEFTLKASFSPDDFKNFYMYFKNPYNRNLVKNPCDLGSYCTTLRTSIYV